MQKTNKITIKNFKKKEKDKFIEDIISDTKEDFLRRQKDRANIERKWQLNMNFLSGNQYCSISNKGDIVSDGKSFFWQNKEVFNHIAPIIESRLNKFTEISPVFAIRPKTDDDSDVSKASLAEKLLSSLFERSDLKSVVKKTTMWSETCGSGFYKILWDNGGGDVVGVLDGEVVREGDVKILSVSPFEIFPDNLFYDDIEDCFSIIHARALPVRVVKEKYGVDLIGKKLSVYKLKSDSTESNFESSILDAVLVIEKYEKPSKDFPNGRLITVADDKLLYYGELPFINGEDGTRTFPFIKQDCLKLAGSFFGTSIVERLIPIQRSFNAVKNRKHEFLNRISMGVMKVEDGSIDVEDLENDGLEPGKILVYRQGSNAPEMMNDTTMPSEFNDEETKLLNEFTTISGVADVSSAMSNATVSSGTALEILVEQDNARLVVSAEEIRRCYLGIAKQSIRLYSQFFAGIKAIKVKDEFDKIKILYADKTCLKSDEIYIQNENELLYSKSQRKEMIFKLYESGLISDKNGNIRASIKEKVLSLLGYKDLDYLKGITAMQENKAKQENIKIRNLGLPIEEIDDDEIHIEEHTRYVLCEYDELSKEEKIRLFNHVKAHKERLNNEIKGEQNGRQNNFN